MLALKNFKDPKTSSNSIQYNTISFIDKTKKVRAPADTAATGTITQYIGIWKIGKLN